MDELKFDSNENPFENAEDGGINIFDIVPEPERHDFFKFEKIGDSVQGTYIARNDNSINSYGAPQTLVTLKKKDGALITVSIRHGKVGLLKVLDGVSLGQIIGFKFTGEKPSVSGSGRQPTKFIRLAQDPKIVDEEWLKEQVNPQRTVFVAPVTFTAPTTIKPVFVPTSNPSTNDEKIKRIIELAKTKFNATDETSVKQQVMEKTGLAFININLDLILERMLKI